MVAHALRPAVGAMGALLLYPDGTIQHGGVGARMRSGADHAYRDLQPDHRVHRGRSELLRGKGAATGACQMLRRKLLEGIGGLDKGLAVELTIWPFPAAGATGLPVGVPGRGGAVAQRETEPRSPSQWYLHGRTEELQGQHDDSINLERDNLAKDSKIKRPQGQRLQPDILDKTKRHAGMVLIEERKQVFVFVHSAKSGGSSFWHSLAKACQNNAGFAIADARHESIQRFGDDRHQRDAVVQLLQDFTGLKKRNLLLHCHTDETELHQEIPPTMAVTYILLIRNEIDRLKSAYKWYLQTELLVSRASSQEDVMSFFSTFLAKGYHKLMPAILGSLEDPSKWATLENPANIAILSIDDYNKAAESSAIRSIIKLLGCETPEPFVFSGTVTSNHSIMAHLPDLSNDEFWYQIYTDAKREVGFLRSLRPINALDSD